jgi:RimJ/RimL family protein N-acetyltransferase
MTASFPEIVPVLTDGVVTLRAHRRDDAEAIYEQCTDPEMQRWTNVPSGYTREHAAGFVDRAAAAWDDPNGNRQWAIEWLDGGQPRFGGSIDVRPGAAADTASIGFGLHPAARGAGVMSGAVRLAASHAFGTGPWGRPLSRLHWAAVVGNWSSRRVAWATGFTFHGTLPGSHPNTVDPEGPALDTWQASLATGDPMSSQSPWFEPVELQGNGIRLRGWRSGDIEAIEARDDPEHWMPGRSVLRREMFPDWLERRYELMAQGQGIDWCIADPATDRALGGVTIFSRGAPMTGDVAELGYQLFPSSRGRGVAKEASKLVIRHALTPQAEGGLGLRRLVAETAADNGASNGVLKSTGFEVWGREHLVDLLPDGSYGDGLHWELLPDS